VRGRDRHLGVHVGWSLAAPNDAHLLVVEDDDEEVSEDVLILYVETAEGGSVMRS